MIHPSDIADRFTDVFAESISPFSADHLNTARSKFYSKQGVSFSCSRPKASPCSASFISDIVQKLKIKTAANLDGLTAEHIIFNHPVAVSVITKLVNLMLNILLMHSVLVSQFLYRKTNLVKCRVLAQTIEA